MHLRKKVHFNFIKYLSNSFPKLTLKISSKLCEKSCFKNGARFFFNVVSKGQWGTCSFNNSQMGFLTDISSQPVISVQKDYRGIGSFPLLRSHLRAKLLHSLARVRGPNLCSQGKKNPPHKQGSEKRSNT